MELVKEMNRKWIKFTITAWQVVIRIMKGTSALPWDRMTRN